MKFYQNNWVNVLAYDINGTRTNQTDIAMHENWNFIQMPKQVLTKADKCDGLCWIYINYEHKIYELSFWSAVNRNRYFRSGEKLVDLYARPDETETNRVV